MGRFLLEAGKRPASIKLRLNVHMLQSSNDISRISYIYIYIKQVLLDTCTYEF